MARNRIKFKYFTRSGIYISVRLLLLLLGAAFFGVFQTPAAHAAHTQASLVLASETVRPGETVMAGIHLRMESGWHTYWRNPGGSGMPTTINWKLPTGVTAGEIQWPVPEKLPADELTTYVYKDDVMLLVPITIAPNAPTGPLDLKAQVSWLECNMSCIPGKADVQTTLNVGAESKASANAALIETWRKKLPVAKPDLAAKAWWEKPASGDTRAIIFEWPGAGPAESADFFPFGDDKFEVLLKAEPQAGDGGKIRLKKEIKKLEGNWPEQISGLLVQQSGGESIAHEVALPIAGTGNQGAAAPSSAPAAKTLLLPVATGSTSLLKWLAYAFLGGLILNIMPCVLPVIALKILGFVNQGKKDPREVRKLGFIYGAGVLASFLVLAALVIGVQLVGHAASWGMQFQNPQFLVGMTVLVTLVALNLFGLFEITLSGRAMGAAGNLASKGGSAGAFFNGVLATALATPCTAPFLGAALGFAFTQPPVIIVLIFLTVGAGLAAPYVVLCWQPSWLKFLPKPGAWMERFKVAMGFPMLATAIWLFTLAAPNFGGSGELWLGLFLVLVAVIAWVWGEFVQRGRSRRGLAAGLSFALCFLAYAYVLEGQLHWRSPVSVAGNQSFRTSADGIEWGSWSPEAIQSARATGRPVLVDFTAKWCLTCQLNKKTSLEIPSVRAKLKEINAIALIENSSKKDATVVAELNRYQRAGVPLVLVYPRDPEAPPQVLPEVLTPGIVLEALEKAARQAPAISSAAANR
ncbi:MAG: thiol-disulfide interchange protein DsbD-like protein [Pedosphaera sp.]|nr:thiol-disulfide interchange protein DsbD-like protein [Pedosphaera sp.]